MAGKQAKILSGQALDQLLGYADRTRNPARNKQYTAIREHTMIAFRKAFERCAQSALATLPVLPSRG